MSDENFEIAFRDVIGLEGGYVNDPDDPGGETKYGISKRSYPHLDIANLTLVDAKKIYHVDFWLRMMLHELLSSTIACEIFEQGVNMGRSVAITHCQKSISLIKMPLIVDGFIGPKTIAAMNSLRPNEIEAFLKCMNGYQFKWYEDIVTNKPTQRKYFVGWLKRVELARVK